MQHNLLKRVILEQHEVIRRAEIVPRSITLPQSRSACNYMINPPVVKSATC